MFQWKKTLNTDSYMLFPSYWIQMPDWCAACITPMSCNARYIFSSCCYSFCKYLPWPLATLLDGYTFYSVSQERIMDEMDEEAKRARMHGPKTGANWDTCVACLLLDCVSLNWEGTYVDTDLYSMVGRRFECWDSTGLFLGFEGCFCCWLKLDLSWFCWSSCQWKGLIRWP